MTAQPEALRLADVLENKAISDSGTALELAAAAELRRLHELAMDQQGKIYALEMARSMQQKTAKLKRDALLEALKDIDKEFRKHGRQHWPEAVKARAAIAKAEWKA